MTKMILVFVALCLVTSCQSVRQPNAEANQELTSHMDRYVALFNATDSETIAEEVYAVPVLRVDPATSEPTVMETTAEVQQF